MIALLLSASIMSSFSNVEFIRNHDGDTFTVRLKNTADVFGFNIPVRIKGIDTPEMKGTSLCEKFDAIEARDVLFNLLDGKPIDLINCERDKYFRLLCDVKVSGLIDVKAYMLSNAYAVSYDGASKPTWNCKRVMP